MRIAHTTYRHGTSTLSAALGIAAGQVIAALKPRYRHQKFLAFLRQIERSCRHVTGANVVPVELHPMIEN